MDHYFEWLKMWYEIKSFFNLEFNKSIISQSNHFKNLPEKKSIQAKRLLPAFDTKTGMPYGTVNLRYGVPVNETR